MSLAAIAFLVVLFCVVLFCASFFCGGLLRETSQVRESKQFSVKSLLILCCAFGVQTAWAAPANDNFANAQLVTGNPSNLAGSTVGATSEPGEPLVTQPQLSIWYKWVASGTGYTSFATSGSAFDTIISVYTGATLTNLSLIADNDDLLNPDNNTVGVATNTSRVNFLATAGVQYYICIVGFTGESGVTKLSINRFDPSSLSLSVTNGASNGQVSLAWPAVSGATAYRVYRSTTATDYRSSAVYGPTTNNYLDTVPPGQTFYYTVKAVVTGGKTYGSKEVSATLLAPPSGLRATSGNGTVLLNWNATSGAASYDLWRSEDNTTFTALGSNLTTNSYNDNSVINGRTYYYKVRASNSSGKSLFSVTVTANPLLPAPANLRAAMQAGGISLNWTGITSNATRYDIYRRTEGGTYPVTPIAFTSGGFPTNYFDSISNGKYFYVVRAANSEGQSPASNEASAIALSNPGLSGSAGDGQVTLNWNAIQGATGYRIYRRTGSFSSPVNPANYPATPLTVVLSPTTTYTDRQVINGTTYCYIIRAYNDSDPNNEIVTAPFNEFEATPRPPAAPPAPLNLMATGQTNQISLSWNAATRATSYNVFRAQSSGGYDYAVKLNPAPITGTSFIDNTGTNGILYYYVVRAVNSGADSGSSNEDFALSSASGNLKAHFFPRVIPDYPSGFGSSRMVNGLFQGSNDNNTWTNLGIIKTVPSEIAYTDLNLGANSYRYLRYLAPAGSYANIAELEFYDGTTRLTGRGFGSPGSYQNDPNVTFAAALDGNTATYFDQVNGDPGYFVGIDTTLPPAAPTNLGAVAGTGKVALTWTASLSPGVTGHKVYRRVEGGAYNAPLQPGPTGTSTSYTDTPASNGTKYLYVVRAFNATTSVESLDSNEATTTPISAPTGLSAIPGSGRVRLSWNKVTGATSYGVKRNDVVLSGVDVPDNGSNTLSHTDSNGLQSGVNYSYKVFARNVIGTSDDSAPATASPTSTGGVLQITNIQNGDFLSNDVAVSVNAANLSETVLKLDGNIIDRFPTTPVVGNSNSVFLSTEDFANGTHTIEVADNAGNTDIRTVEFYNAVSNLDYDPVFDISAGATNASQSFSATASILSGKIWTATIEDLSGNTIKTFSGNAPLLSIAWNGINAQDGAYTLRITTADAMGMRSESSVRHALYKPEKGRAYKYVNIHSARRMHSLQKSYIQSVSAPTTWGPTDRIINKDGIKDTFILIDTSALQGHDSQGNPIPALQLANAKTYARNTIDKIDKKFGASLLQHPHALILSRSALIKRPTLARRINDHFSSQLSLVYVLAHAAIDGTTYPGTNNLRIRFSIGKYSWWSSNVPEVNGTTDFAVSDLVYPINYGETGDPNSPIKDPPRLVWMDNCNSMGAIAPSYPLASDRLDSNSFYHTPRYTDSTWAACFGVDGANGYQGCMMGWSGHMILPQSGEKWDTWRDTFWSRAFGNAQTDNIQTAIARANTAAANRGQFSVPPAKDSTIMAPSNPEDSIRLLGSDSTNF